MIRCEVERDSELPAASVELFGLGSELLLTYLFVFYPLLYLRPIYKDKNASSLLIQYEFDVQVMRMFVLESKA